MESPQPVPHWTDAIEASYCLVDAKTMETGAPPVEGKKQQQG
jgi:hypothetical protein